MKKINYKLFITIFFLASSANPMELRSSYYKNNPYKKIRDEIEKLVPDLYKIHSIVQQVKKPISLTFKFNGDTLLDFAIKNTAPESTALAIAKILTKNIEKKIQNKKELTSYLLPAIRLSAQCNYKSVTAHLAKRGFQYIKQLFQSNAKKTYLEHGNWDNTVRKEILKFHKTVPLNQNSYTIQSIKKYSFCFVTDKEWFNFCTNL